MLILVPEFIKFVVKFSITVITASFTFFEFNAWLGISSIVNSKLLLFADLQHQQQQMKYSDEQFKASLHFDLVYIKVKSGLLAQLLIKVANFAR